MRNTLFSMLLLTLLSAPLGTLGYDPDAVNVTAHWDELTYCEGRVQTEMSEAGNVSEIGGYFCEALELDAGMSDTKLNCLRIKFSDPGHRHVGVIKEVCGCNNFWGLRAGSSYDSTLDCSGDKEFTYQCAGPGNGARCDLPMTGEMYFFILLIFIIVCLLTGLLIYQFAMMARMIEVEKPIFQSAKWTSLSFNMMANIMMLLWHFSYFLGVLGKNTLMIRRLANQSGVPFTAVFLCTGCMNVSLMWVQVYEASQSMKRASSNLQKKYVVRLTTAILACLISCFATFFFNTQLGTLCIIVWSIMIIVAFAVGRSKLYKLVGENDAAKEKLKNVRDCSRRVIICLTYYICLSIAFTLQGILTYYGVGNERGGYSATNIWIGWFIYTSFGFNFTYLLWAIATYTKSMIKEKVSKVKPTNTTKVSSKNRATANTSVRNTSSAGTSNITSQGQSSVGGSSVGGSSVGGSSVVSSMVGDSEYGASEFESVAES